MKTLLVSLSVFLSVCLQAQTIVREQGSNKTTGTSVLTNSFVPTTAGLKAYSVFGYNNGADQWVMIFPTNATPANGTVPRGTPIKVPAGKNFSVTWPAGRNFTNGVTIVNSTTAATLTLGAKDFFYEVNYYGGTF